MSAPVHILVDDTMAGQRLDRVLRKRLPEMPLGAIFKLLRQGLIKVDGGKCKPDLRLTAGMAIELPEGLRAVKPSARKVKLVSAVFRGKEPKIVHRDSHVMVVDKPAGMASQPGSGNETGNLVDWLDLAVKRSEAFAPSPAHRIDRATSGLVAIGLSPQGLRGLTAAFREDRVRKVYLAIVHGEPAAHGTIREPLLEVDAENRGAPKVIVDPRGKEARTDFEVIRVSGDRALLSVHILSGRMHQIRAHLAWLGHPIVGDRRYGSPVRMGEGILLHASELAFDHPVLGHRLDLRAEPPGAFAVMLAPD